jgi:hypothetical protein
MKYPITQFKSLEVALKELEPYVRNGQHLLTGRRFRKFGGMLSREVWANWLLCVALNEEREDGRSFTFCSDPLGGDGLIVDSATGHAVAQTEHVMIASHRGSEEPDVKTLVLRAVEKKRANGEAYATGKTLVVFLNADVANKIWWASEVARQLPEPLYFKGVWLVGLECMEAGEYVYNVVHLDVSDGHAPTMRVRVAKDFASWTATRVQ